MNVVGSWRLRAWRRLVEGGETTYPPGEHATGVLLDAEDGTTAVQMVAADRPAIAIDDALRSEPLQRTAVSSTFLAYLGTDEVQNDSVSHLIQGRLFPNWSGTKQSRRFPQVRPRRTSVEHRRGHCLREGPVGAVVSIRLAVELTWPPEATHTLPDHPFQVERT